MSRAASKSSPPVPSASASPPPAVAGAVRWMPDAEAAQCMSCSKAFKFSRRKHHCRLCGNVVCDWCSTKRLRLTVEGVTARHRVCDECFVSAPPAVGGGNGFQNVNGGGSRGLVNGGAAANGNGNGKASPALTPAQQLLGAPEPSVYPAVSQVGSANSTGSGNRGGDATDYQPLSDDALRSPNAHRRVYTSVAQNPDKGCCVCCTIM